jgi:hypothetical protein
VVRGHVNNRFNGVSGVLDTPLVFKEEYIVDAPQQKKRKSKSDEQKKPAFRFLKSDLSKSEKEQLWAMDTEAEFPLNGILDLVLEGYSVRISRDEYHQCFTASLVDTSKGSPFENTCLTGRGAAPADAWHSLAYRHFHLAEEDWTYFVRDDTPDRGNAW